ncbi:PIG-L deacetylase family protein [Gracilimonas tropica]|uniref:PIG-L deacetylase family protein n=1 Tax=Gracilimonas tropica TaxID=454600 RepID=UPI0012FB3EEC|nr:PIG-L family deacetylase [Gracilimonas tropica]
MKRITILLAFFALTPFLLFAQPETPVEEWTGRTILFIGAHPDDDGGSHGTMSMLQDNGNEVYVMLLTTGNVGTGDPTMTRDRLAKIRRQEEVDALKELGIPEENYINLGYTDGMLEFADREEVVKRIVWWIRKLQPTTLMAFDPGYGYQQWHKTDHRTASYLAVDAARAAEWRLIFPSQIINEGLKEHSVTDYLFYSTTAGHENTWVDISDYAENKVRSLSKYVSQFTSAFDNYTGPNLEDLPGNEGEEFLERMRRRVFERGAKDGKPMESFRYYRGNPDGAGSRRD